MYQIWDLCMCVHIYVELVPLAYPEVFVLNFQPSNREKIRDYTIGVTFWSWQGTLKPYWKVAPKNVAFILYIRRYTHVVDRLQLKSSEATCCSRFLKNIFSLALQFYIFIKYFFFKKLSYQARRSTDQLGEIKKRFVAKTTEIILTVTIQNV